MTASTANNDLFGLPRHNTRTWVVENSEPEELGYVRKPSERRQGNLTHAFYRGLLPQREMDCANDDSVMWELEEYITDPSIIWKLEEQNRAGGQARES